MLLLIMNYAWNQGISGLETEEDMKAFLILEDGNVFEGTSIGSKKEIISEIVFNTSMTGYLEVLTDHLIPDRRYV